jgi:hypothetical protein
MLKKAGLIESCLEKEDNYHQKEVPGLLPKKPATTK